MFETFGGGQTSKLGHAVETISCRASSVGQFRQVLTDTESKTERQTFKMARNAIETGVQAKSEKGAVEYLQVLQISYLAFRPPLEDSRTEDLEKNSQITYLEKKLAAIKADKEKQISDLKLKLDNLKLGNHANSLVAEVLARTKCH